MNKTRIIKTCKASTGKLSRDRKRLKTADKKVKRDRLKQKYAIG